MAQGSKKIFFINFINFCPIFNNKWPNFWYFKVFISAKCVYRLYLAYLLFILSKKKEFCHFKCLRIFRPYYKYSTITVHFSLKNGPHFQKKTNCRYDFFFYGMFFVLFLDLNSDKFHYNSVSSKGTVFFCSLK